MCISPLARMLRLDAAARADLLRHISRSQQQGSAGSAGSLGSAVSAAAASQGRRGGRHGTGARGGEGRSIFGEDQVRQQLTMLQCLPSFSIVGVDLRASETLQQHSADAAHPAGNCNAAWTTLEPSRVPSQGSASGVPPVLLRANAPYEVRVSLRRLSGYTGFAGSLDSSSSQKVQRNPSFWLLLGYYSQQGAQGGKCTFDVPVQAKLLVMKRLALSDVAQHSAVQLQIHTPAAATAAAYGVAPRTQSREEGQQLLQLFVHIACDSIRGIDVSAHFPFSIQAT